ncbi:MAG: hypothetical protein ACLP5H_13315 [Desulfomonilaceae bacterium]
MESKIDFEQLLAEGRVIEIAEQMGSNAGRIDSLEENSYATGIATAREQLGKMTRILDQETYMNFWVVFESAYQREWDKEHTHSPATNN